jgi:hypothetical protein
VARTAWVLVVLAVLILMGVAYLWLNNLALGATRL